MKKQLLGLFLCAGAFVSYGQDTTGQQNQNMAAQDAGIKCAVLDANTLACFSPEVDTDKDNFVSEDEWTNADPAQVGIIDISSIDAARSTTAPDSAAEGGQSMSGGDTTASGSQWNETDKDKKKKDKKKDKMNKKDHSSGSSSSENPSMESEGLDNTSGDARLEEDDQAGGSTY